MRFISSKGRVRSRKNCRPSVQSGHNASFGNTDSLLFQSLMDRDSIIGPHLVQFIYTVVSEDAFSDKVFPYRNAKIINVARVEFRIDRSDCIEGIIVLRTREESFAGGGV